MSTSHLVPLLFGVALFFATSLLILALVLVPEVRARVGVWARLGWASGSRWLGVGSAHGRLVLGCAVDGARRWQGKVALDGRPHGRRWAIAALVIVGLPLLALALRGFVHIDAYDHTAVRDADERVAALLRGEELAPPAALPPELFTTPEVEAERPQARFANREWALLDPEFRRRLLVVFRVLAEEHGYEAALLEGFRDGERQAALAAAGARVTRAGAFRSYHQYGLAADVAFMRRGRIVISERDPWARRGYELYGEVARSVGLTWGGSWRSLKDYGHVELRRAGVMAQSGDNRSPRQDAEP